MSKVSKTKLILSRVPSDLFILWLLGTWPLMIALGYFSDSGVRTVLGILAILFAPGYALVAALFPAEQSAVGLIRQINLNHINDSARITAGERLLLGVGLSVCIVPLLGICLNYVAGSLNSSSLLRTVGATTLLLTVIAAVRRQRTPLGERFNPQPVGAVRAMAQRTALLREGSIITILVVAGLIISASGIGFAALRTDQGEQFTEFYLLTEDPETGDYVAGDYPDKIAREETETVQVGITNHEGKTEDYTVVVLLQSIDENGNIQRVQNLDSFELTVQPGETVSEPHAISPEITGKDLRVTYLLYAESPPDDTGFETDNAYRTVHFWIDVPEPNSA